MKIENIRILKHHARLLRDLATAALNDIADIEAAGRVVGADGVTTSGALDTLAAYKAGLSERLQNFEAANDATEKLGKNLDPMITVPDLVGMDKVAARDALVALNATFEARDVYSEDVPKGTVIKHRPAAGDEIESDVVIYVAVSAGVAPPPEEEF